MRQRHLISGASILRLWQATVVHSAQCFVNEVSMRAKPPRAHVCLYCVRIFHFDFRICTTMPSESTNPAQQFTPSTFTVTCGLHVCCC